jgi:hypothetical protein
LKIKRNVQVRLISLAGKRVESLYHETEILEEIFAQAGAEIFNGVETKAGASLNQETIVHEQSSLATLGLMSYLKREYRVNAVLFMWLNEIQVYTDPVMLREIFERDELVYLFQRDTVNTASAINEKLVSKKLSQMSHNKLQGIKIANVSPKFTFQDLNGENHLERACIFIDFDSDRLELLPRLLNVSKRGFKKSLLVLRFSSFSRPRSLVAKEHDLTLIKIIDELICKSHECALDLGIARFYRPSTAFFD